MLEARNVSKSYPTPRGSLSILTDISLALEQGESISIVGPSGTGKSTLLYILGALEPPTSGTVSFKVVWSGVDERLNIKNTDPVYGGFAGEFVRNRAQMEWSAAVGDYTFVSDPMATSSSSFAEIGHERNESFFRHRKAGDEAEEREEEN